MKRVRRPNLMRLIGERVANFDMPQQLRRPVRLLGYPVFGAFVAMIAFALALPRDKIRERLETLLSQDPTVAQPLGLGADVKASELSLSLWSRAIVAENVVFRTRPARVTDKPARYVLDKVKVGVGLIGLLFQRPTYSFDIAAFEGTIEGAIRVTATASHYEIEGNKLALLAVQGLQSALGLPIEGKVEGKLSLDAPGRLLSSSSGTLEITIDNAAIGDGKSKLTIPGDPFLGSGVTFPRIRLGKIYMQISIDKGKARFEELHAHSPDGDLTLEGYMDLHDPFVMSQMHGYLRFKLADALVKREATIELLVNNFSTQGKRADGFIGAHLTGSIGALAFAPNKTPPVGVITKSEGAPATPTTPTVVPSTTPPTLPPSAVGFVPPPPSATADAAQAAPDLALAPPPPQMRENVVVAPPAAARRPEPAEPAPAPTPPTAPPPVVDESRQY